MCDSIQTSAPQVADKNIKAIAILAPTRSPILPDVPTIAEAGVPDFHFSQWIGVMAPARTPQPIVDLLHKEITKIVSRPDIKKSWVEQGADPLVMSQPEFKTFMDSEVKKWARIIEANKIQPIN
jgi:tripartite-type tricarboxylate transporter receptor subunit TctC